MSFSLESPPDSGPGLWRQLLLSRNSTGPMGGFPAHHGEIPIAGWFVMENPMEMDNDYRGVSPVRIGPFLGIQMLTMIVIYHD